MTAWRNVTRGLGRFWPSLAPPRAATATTIARVRDQAGPLRTCSDEQLAHQVDALREQVRHSPIDAPELVAPAFTLMLESVRRTFGMSLFDVQLLAGLVLADKSVAEMQTGEGKTLAVAAPALLFALAGRGVHVMTSNEYLAGRDFEQLEPCFRRLGVSVGLLRSDDSPEARRAAYQSDVTYGAGNEFGFDYLKDQIDLLREQTRGLGVRYRRLLREDCPTPERAGLQRGQAFAIVDEIDSVLIDEANTPLILSGTADSASSAAESYAAAWRCAQELCADDDFVVDPKVHHLRLTDAGLQRIRAAGRRAAKLGLHQSWELCIEQALKARCLLERDVDYVVIDDKVQLVDAATGRISADRSLRDGLQQLLEVKENVPLTPEKVSIARITRQRYFRLYDQVCGLTGTAAPSRREFQQIYSLPVVSIPPRKPSRRVHQPSRFFAGADEKWQAIAQHIQQLQAAGKPVLAGTTNIQNSLVLADQLRRLGVEFQILNGVQDADEAAVVAAAGQLGVVTIATNMAGRGTDIRLGPGVAERGGLHVVGTEHQPSARLDGQLAGRAGRQGDPGSAQFFLSCDDPLICQHAPHLAARMRRLARSDGEILVNLALEVAGTQRRVEYQMFQQRRRLAMSGQWLEEVVAQLVTED